MRYGVTIAACVLMLFLAACGFRPLYQDASTLGGDGTVLDTVTISSVVGANGQQLKNELIDRFYNSGYPDQPRFVLVIHLQEFGRSVVIQKDDVTSRAQIVLRARYSLTNQETRKVISSGDVRAVGSYNILGSQYATIVTQKNARDLAIKELADKMTLRIATILNTNAVR